MTAFTTRVREHAANRVTDSEPERRPPWRLGLIADRSGHVHLGASIPPSPGQPETYIDLLAAVGAAGVASLDLEDLSVLVRGEHMADLQRIIRQCIDDRRLRRRLLQLVALAAPSA
jgi:hypothetical protein